MTPSPKAIARARRVASQLVSSLAPPDWEDLAESFEADQPPDDLCGHLLKAVTLRYALDQSEETNRQLRERLEDLALELVLQLDSKK